MRRNKDSAILCKWTVVLSLLVYGCGDTSQSGQNVTTDATRQLDLEYAIGFTAEYIDNYKLVTVPKPFRNASSGFKYALVPHGDDIPELPADVKVVRIPIQTVVCTSTTHLPLLDLLDESDKLVGFPTVKYISSETIQQRIRDEKVRDLGSEKGLNVESLLDLQPELMMTYVMNADYTTLDQIENANIPVVLNAEYLEETPLGRAEWIKFAALFFDKEQQADSVFSAIRDNYLRIQGLADATSTKPSVYSGVVYGDSWFMPSGNSWAGKFFKDAGANFLWSETTADGSLELSFESVYDTAYEADFWIGTASFGALAEIEASDSRYTNFKAFKEGTVFTYNARVTESGGNDFFESGFARPDLVLADLFKILHPEKLPEHQLYFYSQLK